ncbi:MAG: flavodoxin-dependent (E)-4-hydroxy-3-methylbut-2-enyl-diphosphate synthase [Clostridia bacterium]|nr:flavodoxin-dependent (E)-4-hydroxy-3-methylbut-2-enyl-diphosphate synthase [Clostridia bacterium]
MKTRRISRQIDLGGQKIGGGAPISVQSMTNTKTEDIEATLGQIKALAACGCDIVRLSVPHRAAADALVQIVKTAPVPLVADIHFDYRLALAAIKAGVAGLRLNPGNISEPEQVREVVLAAKSAGTVMRIGVNGGSLEARLLEKYGGPTAEALCESALAQVAILEKEGFYNTKISVKTSSAPLLIESNRLLAAKCDYPLHLGLTEAGTAYKGAIRSAAALGALLNDGIGDTIRVSLAGDPVAEVTAAQEILRAFGLYNKGFEYIVCPTCARTSVDVAALAAKVERSLAGIMPPRPIKIAVMGCLVNGPGEAREADIAVIGAGKEGVLYIKGQKKGKFPEDQLLAELLRQINILVSATI